MGNVRTRAHSARVAVAREFAKEGSVPIDHRGGALVITGDSITYARMCALKGAVALECKGFKRRGPVVWKQVAKEFGVKGNRQAVYDWLCYRVDEMSRQQEHLVDDDPMTKALSNQITVTVWARHYEVSGEPKIGKRVLETWNIVFDEANPDKPWVGGSASGYGGTYRANSLAGVLELVSEEVVRKYY